MNIKTKQIQVRNKRVSLIQTKRKTENPPIQMLHGAGCHHSFWLPLLSQMSGYECLAASMPGRSSSENPALKNIPEMASWAFEVARETKLDAPIVIGHSMGGAIAMEMALSATEQQPIRGLVLLATGARLRVHKNIFTLIREAQAQGQIKDLNELAWQSSTPKELIELSIKEPPPMGTTFCDWKAANLFDRMKNVPQIEVPTLIIGGENDPLTPPKYAQFLANNIPNATLNMLPKAGHMFPVESANEVAHSIQLWITEQLHK